MPYSAQGQMRALIDRELVDRQPDASRIEDQDEGQASDHLQVRVTDHQHLSGVLGEHVVELPRRCGLENGLVVGTR